MNVAGYEIKKKEAYKTAETYDNGVAFGIHPSQNCPARYATWEYTENHETGVISAFWGHYFDSEVEAYKDYYSRLANNFDRPWEEE